MKDLYEVTLTYTALVLADNHDHAREVAREEASEIISDSWGPNDIDVVGGFRSREELAAHGYLRDCDYDLDQLPYGDTKQNIGLILEALEEADAVPLRCRGTIDMFNPAPEVVAEQLPAGPPNFRLILARQHLQAGEDWLWCRMEYIDEGQFAGTLIEGGVPRIGADGNARWLGVPLDKVFVREDEVRAAEMAYERETGNCFHCAGSGTRNAGWHHERGHEYRDCARCGATGKAPQS